ncbi:hypothetical protein [Argonema antarcticum]|uniref:hypothetical protein n=1 Tax=Argonema antarcticum TaxID=2942763 RepID=UPI002012DD1B|nr:hypothetical protein [Argonema antarcticum]MCL1469108.1 hypothetical protein [Argonema antarcticum A004/B2]
MWEKILTFVTPGPMTETFSFRPRVFYSWISLGVILTLIMAIRSLMLGYPIDIESLIAIPIVFCLFGLFGLGLDSVRGRSSEYPGWYWLFYPIVTYLVIGFVLSFALIGFVLGFGGIRLPQPPRMVRHPKSSKIDPQKFRQELKNMKAEELLKEFDKQLKEIEKSNKIKPEEKKVIKKLQELDRSGLRSELRNALNDDEMEILFMLILKLLGFELR